MIIGTIELFAFPNSTFNYWLPCQGQTLQINSYKALYSVIGHVFGGDGVNTFCLPDLQGRAVTGMAHDGSNFGVKSGKENVTIHTSAMPSHAHALDMNQTIRIQTSTGLADSSITNPVGNSLAYTTTPGEEMYNNSPTPGIYLGDSYISPVTSSNGSGMAMPVRNPYACINFSIVINGEYPTRN